jgi:hypothetical protein
LPSNCRILKDKVLPSDNVFSGSCKEENKLFIMLCVEYISYHACPNDFILYRGEYANKEIGMKYGHDKYYKLNKNGKMHGPPHKILRHMTIIRRIQRIFHCKELAMLQGWHAPHISELRVM